MNASFAQMANTTSANGTDSELSGIAICVFTLDDWSFLIVHPIWIYSINL
jgi:hypothetical protein